MLTWRSTSILSAEGVPTSFRLLSQTGAGTAALHFLLRQGFDKRLTNAGGPFDKLSLGCSGRSHEVASRHTF
jgi:hypothetical protein